VRVRDGEGDQHHATVALGADGRGAVTFAAEQWTVLADLPLQGPPAPASLPFSRPAHHPQVVWRGDQLLLAATALDGGGLFVGRFTRSGEPVDAGARLGEGLAMHPDLTLGAAHGLLTWAAEDGIRVWRFDDDPAVGEALPVLPLRWAGAGTPSVRPRDDGFLVAWTERDLGVAGVLAATLDGDGSPAGPTGLLASWPEEEDDARPAVAVGPGGELVAWRRFSQGEAWLQFRDRGGDVTSEVALHEDAPAGRPAADGVDDTAFVVWEQQREGRWTVVLQRFDLRDGTPLDSAVEVAADTGLPGRPAVAVARSGLGVRGLVSWEVGDGVGPRAVLVRRFYAGQ